MKEELTKMFSLFYNGSKLDTEEIIKMADSGDFNAFRLFAFLRYLEDRIKKIKQGIEVLALEDFEKYGEKEVMFNGVKIAKVEAGVKYDYSKNETWQDVKQEEDEQVSKRKELETYLKSLPKTIEVLEGDQLVKYSPPIKYSKTVLKVTT